MADSSAAIIERTGTCTLKDNYTHVVRKNTDISRAEQIMFSLKMKINLKKIRTHKA